MARDTVLVSEDQATGSDVAKSLLNRLRDRGFGSVSSQEQEIFLSEKQNPHDFLEREARRAPAH